jgi:hypothetical protein
MKIIKTIWSNKMNEMNFSDQAIGALMMALQKSLLEQSDIVPVLKGFRFKLSDQGLMVMNPPVVKFDESSFGEELED